MGNIKNVVKKCLNNDIGFNEAPKKLWNVNFFLLWQGQLVSSLGSVVYNIALGFWVLQLTGSKALMGAIMASSSLPRFILGPFAGVFVDRLDRKWIIVLTDAVRGAAMILLAIAALFDQARIWMIFACGIIMGICGAFFNPAMGSVVPDIVPENKIIKANSLYSIASTGTEIAGTVSGGFVYTLLGAPITFLANGISYIFSAITEMFMRIPENKVGKADSNFKKDFIEGFRFSWKLKGVRYLMLISCAMNFFFQIAFTLMMPMFTEVGGLGEEKYGIVMGFLTGGMLIGMLILSVINIPKGKRYLVFMIAGVVFYIVSIFIPIIRSFYGLSAVLFFVGVSNAIINTIFNSSIQTVVPGGMRGKVLSILGTLSMGLAPIGNLIGGVLGEIFPVRTVMLVSFIMILAVGICVVFIKSLKGFINFNPEVDSISTLMGEEDSTLVLEA
ncbi:MAG: MFS transporter [Clostridiaceae bacterium]